MWDSIDQSQTLQRVSNELSMGKDMTNLFHFEWGFDLGDMPFHISLQRWDVNWLANGTCHV